MYEIGSAFSGAGLSLTHLLLGMGDGTRIFIDKKRLSFTFSDEKSLVALSIDGIEAWPMVSPETSIADLDSDNSGATPFGDMPSFQDFLSTKFVK